MNKAALDYDSAQYSQAGRDIEKSRKHHVAVEGNRCRTLTSKPQPHADIQINRNGLI